MGSDVTEGDLRQVRYDGMLGWGGRGACQEGSRERARHQDQEGCHLRRISSRPVIDLSLKFSGLIPILSGSPI